MREIDVMQAHVNYHQVGLGQTDCGLNSNHGTHPCCSYITMSNILGGLFKDLNNTFESGIKDIKSTGKSADCIEKGVRELISSFDEQEVRRTHGTSRHSETY